MIRNSILFTIVSLITFSAHSAIVSVEPDVFAGGSILDTAYTGVSLSFSGRPDANAISIHGHNLLSDDSLCYNGLRNITIRSINQKI